MIVDMYNHIGAYAGDRLDVRTRDRLKIVDVDPLDQCGSLVKIMDKNGVDKTGIIGPYKPDDVKKYSNRLYGISTVQIDASGKPNIEKVEHDITSLGWKALFLSPTGLTGNFYPNDFEKMGPLYEKARDLDVPTMWHPGGGGHSLSRIIFCRPEYLNEVAFKYRDLKIVITHLGETQPWGQEQVYIELAMTYPNVYIDATAIISYWLWRVMPPKNYVGPPEMARFHVIDRSWVFQNSDKIEGTKKPYTSKDQAMMEAFQKLKDKHRDTIRSCALQCPDKFMLGVDMPFALRQDIALALYREALADDKEILKKVLGENARKLFKL
jgi:predicted TIM-barrel fold metal-dependent hydrolase